MRPGEVCNIKPCWIDRVFDGVNWFYLPEEHKTAGRGKDRPFVFTRTAQEILTKYITDDSHQHLFLNNKNKPFTTRSFGQAIKRTIEKHGIPKFTPYQIRRNVATWGAGELSLDHTRAFLGHADEKMTRYYVDEEIDLAKIKEFAVKREQALAAAVPDEPKSPYSRPALRIFTGD